MALDWVENFIVNGAFTILGFADDSIQSKMISIYNIYGIINSIINLVNAEKELKNIEQEGIDNINFYFD